MARVPDVLGIIGGGILILSSAAHSLLGWDALAGQLGAVDAPAELTQGLRVGWHFGGASMLAFGVIALMLFVRRMRGAAVWMAPAQVIALAYLLFGVWALVITSFDPFFLFFIVPAVVIGVGAAQS